MADIRAAILEIVEKAVRDAHDRGKREARPQTVSSMVGPAMVTVDTDWTVPADRATDEIMAALHAAAPDAPFPVDLDEVRQRGRQVAKILAMLAWPGTGQPAVFGLHLSGDVGAMVQEIDHLRGVLGVRSDGYEGDGFDLSLRAGGIVGFRRRGGTVRLTALGPPGGERDVATMDAEETDGLAVNLAAAAAAARREANGG